MTRARTKVKEATHQNLNKFCCIIVSFTLFTGEYHALL
jgi:hypothetical protein